MATRGRVSAMAGARSRMESSGSKPRSGVQAGVVEARDVRVLRIGAGRIVAQSLELPAGLPPLCLERLERRRPLLPATAPGAQFGTDVELADHMHEIAETMALEHCQHRRVIAFANLQHTAEFPHRRAPPSDPVPGCPVADAPQRCRQRPSPRHRPADRRRNGRARPVPAPPAAAPARHRRGPAGARAHPHRVPGLRSAPVPAPAPSHRGRLRPSPRSISSSRVSPQSRRNMGVT